MLGEWVGADPQLAAPGRWDNGRGGGARREFRGEKQPLLGSEDGREIPLATLGNWGACMGNVLAALSPPYHLQWGFWSLTDSGLSLSAHTFKPCAVPVAVISRLRVWVLPRTARG